MHVFVTGATGWIGSATVAELVAAGHRVTGLARDPAKGAALAKATGAAIVDGTLAQTDLLRDAAAKADAVIHLGFNHDFSRFAANAAEDQAAIEAMGAVLAGKRLLTTGGVALLAPGRLATEADGPSEHEGMPRRSEQATRALIANGVRAATVRLSPTVHGIGEDMVDRGFVPLLMGIAQETGVAAYPGDGANRWPAVHRDDAARLYRLALESDDAMPAYHGVAEEGLAVKAIAEAIGRQLGLPVESRPPEHFGWFANFATMDALASSALTRAALGWEPVGPTLMEDLAHPDYARR